MHFALKSIILYTIPKAVNELWDFLFEDEVVPEPKKQRSNRKKRDTTKLTQHHYDYVITLYALWKKHNIEHPKNKKTQERLVEILNQKLNLNKGRTFYARIWSGKVDRDDLPLGKPVNEIEGTDERHKYG